MSKPEPPEWLVEAVVDGQWMGKVRPKPCGYCGFTWVHRQDCLERMNKMREPEGDWWKI